VEEGVSAGAFGQQEKKKGKGARGLKCAKRENCIKTENQKKKKFGAWRTGFNKNAVKGSGGYGKKSKTSQEEEGGKGKKKSWG